MSDLHHRDNNLQKSVSGISGGSSEIADEPAVIENTYDGFVAKIQACGAKCSMISSNTMENTSQLFETAEALVENLYVGCLSSEMMEFLWTGHLGKERHKARLLAFYKFFNYDPTIIVPSVYFTIFPEICEASILGDDDFNVESIEENYSSKAIYIKVPQMCYQQNKIIDIDFINARNSKLMTMEGGTLVEVEHFFSMKTIQVLFTKFIGERIIKHLSQNMNIQQFRKGKNTRLSKLAEQAIANSPIKIVGHLPIPRAESPSSNPFKKPSPQAHKKTVPSIAPTVELQTVVSIDIPQINIQNELKKSQAVATTGERICLLVYNTYIQENHEKYWIQKTSWAFVPSIKLYVAPTNLYKEEKTLWLSFQPDHTIAGKRDLMELIMVARNNEILINIMNPEFYDMVRPMFSLDVKVFFNFSTIFIATRYGCLC